MRTFSQLVAACESGKPIVEAACAAAAGPRRQQHFDDFEVLPTRKRPSEFLAGLEKVTVCAWTWLAMPGSTISKHIFAWARANSRVAHGFMAGCAKIGLTCGGQTFLYQLPVKTRAPAPGPRPTGTKAFPFLFVASWVCAGAMMKWDTRWLYLPLA